MISDLTSAIKTQNNSKEGSEFQNGENRTIRILTSPENRDNG